MADSFETYTDFGNNEATNKYGTSEATATDAVSLSYEHPILLFDGVCNLCNNAIQFIIERDPEATFRFAPLQSPLAQGLLDICGYEGDLFDSVVLVENGNCYAKSDAVIRSARHLGGIYRLVTPAKFLPRFLRTPLYDFIAARRYGWFGRRDSCMMPSPDIEKRFLAGGPGVNN